MGNVIYPNAYHPKQPDNKIPKCSRVGMLLEKLSQEMAVRHFAKSTQKSYTGYVLDFIIYRQKRNLQSHGDIKQTRTKKLGKEIKWKKSRQRKSVTPMLDRR